MDYYKTLNVSEHSSKDDIKTAYRKLAAKHHPDRGGDTAAFQEIQQAYDTLGDDAKRAEYDAMRNRSNADPFNSDIEHLFKSFGFSFGGGDPFGQFMRGGRKNPDINTSINLHLRETLEDTVKWITIQAQSNVGRTLEIKVPKGVKSGIVMKFTGGGGTVFPNIPPGDLYCKIVVLDDPRFSVHGLDLECELTIDCFDAILGVEREITTLSGKEFRIRISPNTQQFTKFKIPGEGLYEFQKDIKGNLYVKTSVVIPTNLTSDNIEQIKKIKSSL